jgi:hypothetical protein
MVNRERSTQHPSVAFVASSRPGFSTYPGVGQFDQIQEERALHGMPAWASAEGANSLGGAPGDSGMSMETYLARCFNHGATLVDVFGWGIGGTFVTNNPYRLATEDPDALVAYRKFLNGQILVEGEVNHAPVASAQHVTTAQNTATAITLRATDLDDDLLTYTIVTAPANGTLTGTGASRTYTPATNYIGADSFTFRANDGVLNSLTATVSLSVNAPTYAAWKVRYFTAAQQANPAISGPSANPSGDGMVNLLKYAFGLLPSTRAFTNWPTGTIQNVSGSNYLHFSYRQQPFANDLTYTVQVSDDLITWNSEPGYTVVVSQTDNGDGTNQVLVRDVTPISSLPRRFMRLMVTQQ